MGGCGSGRWGGHQKRRLVEGTPCLDFHKSPWKEVLTNPEAASGKLLYRGQSGCPGWTAEFQLAPTTDAAKRLTLDFSVTPVKPPQIVMLAQVPAGFTSRWCAICPKDCARKVRTIYIAGQPPTAACRVCLGLTYESVQQHDKRLDLARRDPTGFLESRSQAPKTPRSRTVTAWLAFAAIERDSKPRKGRTWGRRSTTWWTRLQAELRAECEKCS